MNRTIKPRLLIIDDDENVFTSLGLYLQEEGFDVLHCALTGEDGLRAVREISDINIVITDLQLPDLNGVEIIKVIKTERPHIEVIAITGYGSISWAVEVMKAGAYDFLEKPFEFDKFRLVIERCIQKIETDGLIAQLSGRIFLSYAREDVERVKPIYRNLQASGFNPWMDVYDIVPGERWESSIEEAIQKSAFFFVLISEASSNKRGMIQKEIKLALEVWKGLLDSDIYLIPIRLEACKVPAALKDFQWVDIYSDDGWDRLIAGIRSGLMQRNRLLTK